MHLEVFTDKGNLLIDTHNKPVCAEVWEMLRFIYRHFKVPSTMIEWDSSLPSLQELETELLKAVAIKEKVYESRENSRATL